MKICVIGEDARYRSLAEILKEHGYDAFHAGNAGGICGADTVAAGWNGGGNDPVQLCAERIILFGPKPHKGGRGVIDLSADERYLMKNAELTAEGAVFSAMGALGKALQDCRCGVVGYGRIGSCLCRFLGKDRTVVFSRGTKAASDGFVACPTDRMARSASCCDVFFNTVPCEVFTDDVLRNMRSGSLLIDLASPPYGVDLRRAWAQNVRAWREPALPGRYCPASAAQNMYGTMERKGLLREL